MQNRKYRPYVIDRLQDWLHSWYVPYVEVCIHTESNENFDHAFSPLLER